jgi:tetratricopeptide (TPR) repeat protein
MKHRRHSSLLAGLFLALWAGLAAAQDAADLHRKGLGAVAAGSWQKAIDLLEAATAATPNDLRIGTDYRQAVIAAAAAADDPEVYDRCLAFFEQLVAEHPDAPNAFLNYAFAHVDKIPVEGAITQVILANTSLGIFGSALELEETWLGYYSRGHAYLFWPPIFGRVDNGIADLERAIEISRQEGGKKPYYARAWAALGDGYWRRDEVGKAREIWQQGVELYPADPELLARLERADRAELDAFLDAHYDTTARVGTHLREIFGGDPIAASDPPAARVGASVEGPS